MNLRSKYVFPIMPKAGLTHGLFTWAEAYRLSKLNNALFIHPHWFRIRIGPYLRREKEKMIYTRIMKTPNWGIGPYLGRIILPFLKKVTSRDYILRSGEVLVVKDDVPHSFENLFGMEIELKQRLLSISKDEFVKKKWTRFSGPFICVEYRSGDYKFIAKKSGFLKLDKRQQRMFDGWNFTPLDFFIDAVITLRKISGWDVPVVVSTDAYMDEIGPLLALGNITVARDDSALLKLIEMSEAAVTVMGSSNFAAWGWFLGDALAIYPAGRKTFFDRLGLARKLQASYLFDDENELMKPEIREIIQARLGLSILEN